MGGLNVSEDVKKDTQTPAASDGAKKEEGISQEQVKKVELTADQYDALLTRLEELEGLQLKGGKRDDVDLLAEEGKARKQAPQLPPQQVDLDSMSNVELADFIFNEVDKSNLKTQTEIQTLKVLREIDKCENKYEDFWAYQDDVYKEASQNPTLSIEKAYLLAKQTNPNKGKEKSGEAGSKRTTTEKILNLPSRPSGEKPGIAAGATVPNKVMSLKDAAAMAMKEIQGKK